MQLDDRFYTSTEVAEVLGVSLRSVYRYLEDGKLDAEVKTATGRHRFTKKNILDFLYPTDVAEVNPIAPVTNKVEDNSEPQAEEVDWLAKFREAAAKFKQEQDQPEQPEPEIVEIPAESLESIMEPEIEPEPEADVSTKVIAYYRSMLGGLKDIAQNIDRNARESKLDYAFTMSAGLSLHKPIKPFALLHVYFKHEDRDYYEKVLRLTPSDQNNAQLCVVYSDNENVYGNKEEVHGLYVVSKSQLNRDINEMGDSSLLQELDAVFS